MVCTKTVLEKVVKVQIQQKRELKMFQQINISPHMREEVGNFEWINDKYYCQRQSLNVV